MPNKGVPARMAPGDGKPDDGVPGVPRLGAGLATAVGGGQVSANKPSMPLPLEPEVRDRMPLEGPGAN